MGCKFLTSSQLFALQLRDPTLRQQVALQLLFFVHYTRSRLPTYASEAELPRPKKGDSEAAVQRMKSDNADTLVRRVVAADLKRLHDSVLRVLEATPPNGRELALVLRRLMTREQHWMAWKAASCPAFEKPLPSTAAALAASSGTAVGAATTTVVTAVPKRRLLPAFTEKTSSAFLGRCSDALLAKTAAARLQAKRKGGPGAGTTTGRLGAAAGEDKEQGAAKHLFGDFDFDYSDNKVAALARGLVQYAPTFDTEMQKYTEAEVGAEVE
jgi:hypothetical protein